MKKFFFLNFGHASTPVVGQEGAEVRRVNSAVPNLSDPSNPQVVLEAVQSLLGTVAGEIRQAITDGETIVIGLPGASSVAVGILAILHGALGYFPQALTGTRTETGFVYDFARVLNLNEVRDIGRGLRSKFDF